MTTPWLTYEDGTPVKLTDFPPKDQQIILAAIRHLSMKEQVMPDNLLSVKSPYDLMQETLNSLKLHKPNDRSELDRRFAVMITDMEKVIAYCAVYTSTGMRIDRVQLQEFASGEGSN